MPSIGPTSSVSGNQAVYGPPLPEDAAATPAQKETLFGDDGFSFFDILDAINPLQHIPVVSTIYRAITGDEISPGSRMAGGALFGGPIGFVASILNNAIEEVSGYDVGEHLIAMFEESAPTGEDTPVMMAALAAQDAAGPVSASTENAPTPTAGYYQPAGLAVIERQALAPPVYAPATYRVPGTTGPVVHGLYQVQEANQAQEKAGAATQKLMHDVSDHHDHADGETAYGPQLPETIGEQRISRMMMDALDKYEQMVRERNQSRAHTLEEKIIF